MLNRIAGILMIIGSLLLGIAIALPMVATSNTDIIGGADLPTFLFHFGKTSWMAVGGIILIVVAMFVRHKK